MKLVTSETVVGVQVDSIPEAGSEHGVVDRIVSILEYEVSYDVGVDKFVVAKIIVSVRVDITFNRLPSPAISNG